MQPKEFFTQLKQTIKDIDWPTTNNSVFGENVHVVPQIPINTINEWRVPICFIVDDGAKVYINNPELIEQKFSLHIFTSNQNDNFGEAMLLGANATEDTSMGAGLLDLEEAVIDSLINKTAVNSKKISLLSKSKIKTKEARGNAPFCFRELVFDVLLSYGENSEREEIIRAPGKLYWNPSDISGGSYGSELGYLENGLAIYPDYDLFEEEVQDSGTTLQGVIFRGAKVSVSCEFLSYKSDTIARCFTGSTSSTSIIFPGSLKTGQDFSSSPYSGQLLFVPDDTLKNNLWLFYNVVPISSGTIAQARGINTTMGCTFRALPDGSNRIFFGGKLANLP